MKTVSYPLKVSSDFSLSRLVWVEYCCRELFLSCAVPLSLLMSENPFCVGRRLWNTSERTRGNWKKHVRIEFLTKFQIYLELRSNELYWTVLLFIDENSDATLNSSWFFLYFREHHFLGFSEVCSFKMFYNSKCHE